jgi:hypothetical protein
MEDRTSYCSRSPIVGKYVEKQVEKMSGIRKQKNRTPLTPDRQSTRHKLVIGFDPHGDPIPSASGDIPVKKAINRNGW